MLLTRIFKTCKSPSRKLKKTVSKQCTFQKWSKRAPQMWYTGERLTFNNKRNSLKTLLKHSNLHPERVPVSLSNHSLLLPPNLNNQKCRSLLIQNNQASSSAGRRMHKSLSKILLTRSPELKKMSTLHSAPLKYNSLMQIGLRQQYHPNLVQGVTQKDL